MKKHIAGLDGLRGLAALMIATYHLYLLASSGLPFMGTRLMDFAYQYGWLAVEFFFFTSGFLFYHGARQKKAKEAVEPDLRTFVQGKLTRLYPAYFVALLVCAGLTVLSWAWKLAIPNALNNAVTFAMNLTFIQYIGLLGPNYSFNIPTWYLSVLWLCYLVGRLVYRRRYPVWKEAALSFGCVILGFIFIRTFDLWPILYLPLINLDVGRGVLGFFSGGLFCLLLYEEEKRPSRGRTVVLCAVSLCLLAGFVSMVCLSDLIRTQDFSGDARRFFPTVLFPCVFYLLVHLKRLAAVLDLKPFRFLGRISYSIYLWHYPTIVLLYLLNRHFRLNLPFDNGWFLPIYYVYLILVGALSHRWIEIPGANLMKKYIGGRKPL